jgi:small subunit ribosomal protein S17
MEKIHKIFTGTVVSTKMNKVAVIEVTRRKKHRLYPKTLKRTKKFHVANDSGAKVGDIVNFEETRPISKTVHWRIISQSPIQEQSTVKTDSGLEKQINPAKQDVKKKTKKVAKKDK